VSPVFARLALPGMPPTLLGGELQRRADLMTT
jgi:hypothetical protein